MGQPHVVTMAGVAVACLAATLGSHQARGAVPATSAAEPTGISFESAGFIGGSATGVVALGNVAVASLGRRVEVYDISDPAHPTATGSTEQLPVLASVQAIDAERAYLVELRRNADEPDADIIHVVALGVGQEPEWTGSLALGKGAVAEIAASAGIVLAAGSSGLVVVDARGLAPAVVATLATDDGARSVAAQGGLAAVGTDIGISLFDITDHAAPVALSSLELGAPVHSLSFVGADLLAGTADYGRPTTNGIVSVNLSDPARPWVAGAIAGPDEPDQLVVKADRGWLLSAADGVWGAEHLIVLDLAEWPVVAEVAYSGGLGSSAIAALGDGVWSAGGLAGLARYVLGAGDTIEVASRGPVLGWPAGLGIAGASLLATDSDGELFSLDIVQPDVLALRPSEVEIRYPSLDVRVPSAGPMVVAGERAFATWLPCCGRGSLPGGVLAVDIADAAHPRVLGAWDPRVEPLPLVGLHGITNQYPPVVRGDLLYLSGGPAVLELDVSGPTPTFRGAFDPQCDGLRCRPGGLTLRKDAAWVAMQDLGVIEILLDDPFGEFAQGKQIATTYPATDVATLDDGRLLVATWFDLIVLDPDSGVTLATLDEFSAELIDVVGDRAYAVARRAGDGDNRWFFTAIDVADPVAPRVLGSYEMAPFGPHPYVVSGDWVYLGAGQSGIEIVRMTDSAAPAGAPLYLPALRTSAPSRLAADRSRSIAAAD